ncbi:MAG: helicase, partial [Planctomycetota bacterium]
MNPSLDQNPTSPPTPWQIRKEIKELVMQDLVGPARGEKEEVFDTLSPNLRVKDRYLTGILAPSEAEILPEEMETREFGGDYGEEDELDDGLIPPSGSYMPSSMGFTCSVHKDTKELILKASWGQYKREDSSVEKDEKGKPIRVWKRYPRGGTQKILLQEGPIARFSPDSRQPQVYVQGRVRKLDDLWFISVFLINGQKEKDRKKDESWLFQTRLELSSADGSSPFCSHSYSLNPEVFPLAEYQEERSMDMLYRNYVQFAVGHGVSVGSKADPQNPKRAKAIFTQAIPFYEVPLTQPPTHKDRPGLDEILLDMKVLAEEEKSKVLSSLERLPSLYQDWIQEQRKRLNGSNEDLEDFKKEGKENLDRCEQACQRIQEGIDILKQNHVAYAAFQFMNQAMALQRTHSLYAQKRRKDPKIIFASVDQPQNRRWYPFQLAFILMNLASLADLHHGDRTDEDRAVADLLWFPTGGGKTEAYLGLAAYAMAIRRLQGELEGRSGEEGVAVLMRYTLRVLTLQQFQRASALICACEKIRRDGVKKGDLKWGKEPFRIGLWLGGSTTPNHNADSHEWLKRQRGGQEFRESSPHQITFCPWCGSEIHPGKHIEVETYKNGRCRTLIFCGDPTGECLFSQRNSPKEGLPILVVDEEIYRRLPSLLIATVDKFAQMPWNGKTQMLFGYITGKCKRHGFRSPEIEDSDSHPAKKKFGLEKDKTILKSPLRPPDLIIQDELHLISGPLGSMVGLYETAVNGLSSWSYQDKKVFPKIIA